MWIFILEDSFQKFATLVKQTFPDVPLLSATPFIIPLQTLQSHDIKYEIIIQTAGSVVFTRSKEAHMVIALVFFFF